MWVIVSTLVCGFLGAYGGTEGTSLAWRRIGIPAYLSAIGCYLVGIKALIFLLMIGIFSLGYGEDSWLRKIYHKDYLVRGFIGLLCGAVIYAVSRHWWGLLVSVVWAIFGGDAIIDNEGAIRLMGKKLLVEDLVVYGITGGVAIGSLVV